MEKKKEITFEQNLKELEEIVTKLERGDLPLEKSLEFFEQGINLVKLCQKRLKSAERKVEKVIKDNEGNIEVSEFNES